jgi:NAD(P)-dependent dehydrogenase (short-subunit alcohol dehydrogenase family)
VPQDYVLAHMWFNLAAAQGYDLAMSNRDTVAKLMTPDQIAEAAIWLLTPAASYVTGSILNVSGGR